LGKNMKSGVFEHGQNDGSIYFAVACTLHAVLHSAAVHMLDLNKNMHSGVFTHGENDGSMCFAFACTLHAVPHAAASFN